MEQVGALWSVQDAKARLSELLETCLASGPQTISRRGVPEAVIVSLEQWKQTTARQATLKELLLDDSGRFQFGFPERGQPKHREIDED